MIYCDTSLLVAGLTNEEATPGAQRWLGEQPAGGLCVSGWVGTELSSALAIKLRQGELTLDQRAEVLTHWRRLLTESLVVLPVPLQAWDLAARFADQHELELRAGDALHIAIASIGGHALATLDAVMARGARAVGVKVEAVP